MTNTADILAASISSPILMTTFHRMLQQQQQENESIISAINTTTNMTALFPDTTVAVPTMVDLSDPTSSTSISAILSNVFLFFLIFGMSATVSTKHLSKQLHNKKALLTGMGMQFFIMPLLGYLAVTLMGASSSPSSSSSAAAAAAASMAYSGSSSSSNNGTSISSTLPGFTEAMGITLLVVTSSPGGSYSNWWCSLFNADLALSVAMTAVSTILSVAFLPANLMLYSHLAYGLDRNNNVDSTSSTTATTNTTAATSPVDAIDFETLFLSLGIVLGAILMGLLVSYRMKSSVVFHKWANRGATVSGIALIVVSVCLSSGPGVETSFWSQHWKFYVAVAFPCVIGMILANLIARSLNLSRPECVAISIECCYQNTGIATSIAVTMFSDPDLRSQAVAVPLFYGLVEAVMIGIYCLWAWKAGWTKAPYNDPICTVIAKSYEVEEFEHELEEEAAAAHEAEEADVDMEALTNVSDFDDLPPIHEEGDDDNNVPRRWWQLWKPRRILAPTTTTITSNASTSSYGISGSFEDASNIKKQQHHRDGTLRGRVGSEDNTVATGSTERIRLSTEDSTPELVVAAIGSSDDSNSGAPPAEPIQTRRSEG